jgi:hypothetical protein
MSAVAETGRSGLGQAADRSTLNLTFGHADVLAAQLAAASASQRLLSKVANWRCRSIGDLCCFDLSLPQSCRSRGTLETMYSQ